ncbi:hypothetical protein [Actinoplanes couchii]|uniref:hypothetical protein n=1 Tax=Actinoplanes couchii TaxID=403638 RepID=UPI00194370A0|nr:hypothetical protein [Actinoplanes couchii]MDR6321634.1 hypothetical protein [Actinoplanes couchii]
MTRVDQAPAWRTWLHGVLVAVYLVGQFGSLLCAVLATGDWGALFDPGLDRLGDPKDSLPSGPMLWVVGLPAAFVIYVWFLPLIGFVLALFRPRSRRWMLVWALLTLLIFSPYGSALHRWLID